MSRDLKTAISSGIPETWEDLQRQVARILDGCGFSVEIEKKILTTRGTVEIDVYAEDNIQGRRNKILCECKFWKARVPQHVIHSFRTVMLDSGANKGYIIALEGFQSGSVAAAELTNIELVSWEEFQSAFQERWLDSHMATLVNRAGHKWKSSDNDGAFGIAGHIEIVKNHRPSGQFIAVEIKSGRSYLISEKMRQSTSRRMPVKHRRIALKPDQVSYYRECRIPVIIIWVDPVSENAFWGAIDEDSTDVFRIPHVFDRFVGRQLARLADRWHAVYPAYSDPRTPHFSMRVLRFGGLRFYNECRQTGCLSLAFGLVKFTRRGWRHITSQKRQQTKIRRSIELLGAAKLILAEQEHFHVCRVTRNGHMLYKQTARITHPNRADAIVSVITEQIGDGPHQFLSVYEHSEKSTKREQSKG